MVGRGTHVHALLEREMELEELRDVVARTRRGRGELVVVEGAAGVGKSRLLDAAGEIGEGSGLAVLSATGTHFESDLPFGVVRQLLERPGESLPAIAAADEQGVALIEGFREALLGRALRGGEADDATPHLLLVDDAHWADPPSLRFLVHLTLRISELPISVVVAARPRGAELWPEELEGLAARADMRLLAPLPLSPDAVAEVVQGAIGADTDPSLSEACSRATGGNPFYLHELLRELAVVGPEAGVEAVENAAPQTVLRAVMARLGRAGPAAAELATALAVLGVDSPLEVVADLAEIEVETAERVADELTRAELLSRGEPLRFSHPLIGSSLRGDLGAFALARAHRRAAKLLTRRGEDPSRIAAHLVHAKPTGDPGVVETLRAAATSDRSRGSAATAVKFLRRALAEPPTEASRADVLLELAEAEALTSSPEALEHFEQARDRLADERRRAEASAALARTLHHAGDFAGAAAVADRARGELGDDDPLGARLRGAWIASAVLHPPLHARLTEELDPLIDRARAGEAPNDPAISAILAAWLTSRDEPVELVRELATGAFANDPLVDGEAHGTALGFAAWALLGVDALEEAEERLNDAVAAAATRGATIALAIARHMRAYVRFHRGDLAGAVLDAEQSLEVFRNGWTPSPWSAAILIRAQLERGELDAARAALGLAENATVDRSDRVLLLEARARLRLAEDRADEALMDARAAGEILDEVHGEMSSRQFEWVRLAALAAFAAGREAEADEHGAEAVRRARAGESARQLGQALIAAGTIAGGVKGIGLLTEAVACLEGSPSDLARAHALLELGAARRRAGKRDEAKADLYAALELGDRFGAAPLVARAHEELRSLGLRPRRTFRSGVGSLTPSELRVAELAGRGLSTPQIAHRLYVTPKTVEGHLTQIYRKLEISGRKHLAAALAQSNGRPARADAADAGRPEQRVV